MKKIFYILFCLTALSLAAFEVKGDGSPVDFTRIGISARFWGMGRAGVALADDSGALLLNPAGMAMARSFEMSGMSTQVLGVTNYSLINAVLPFGENGQAFGFSYINENAGTITATKGLNDYGHPIKGDTIENSNTVVSLGFAGKIAIEDIIDDFYVGAMFKGHSRILGDMTASSMAADVGALYKWKPNISLGFTARNAFQSGINYSTSAESNEEHYDTDYVAGVAFGMLDNDLTLAIDQYTNSKFGRTNLGLEYWLGDAVALRSGLAEQDLTFGLGVRYEMLQIDVGMRYQDAPLDNQLYFSVTWGDARRLFLDRPQIEIIENYNRPQNNNIDNAPASPGYDMPEEVNII